jgi:hypothetical protein
MKYTIDYAKILAAKTSCQCPECGKEFTTNGPCKGATCPKCGKEGCKDATPMEDEDMMGTWEEFAKAECGCGSCGAIFYTPGNCSDAVCPVCNEQDDIQDL